MGFTPPLSALAHRRNRDQQSAAAIAVIFHHRVAASAVEFRKRLTRNSGVSFLLAVFCSTVFELATCEIPSTFCTIALYFGIEQPAMIQ
jgi:hypothetical protein